MPQSEVVELSLPKPLHELILKFIESAHDYSGALVRHNQMLEDANRGLSPRGSDIYESAQERRAFEDILKSSVDAVVAHYASYE